MRCLFCKGDSTSSRSVEHIIPESLGNLDHVLPKGVVCDSCNNYLAREVEKPILDSLYFRERRFFSGIPNKRDRIPALDGFHVQSRTRIQLLKNPNEETLSIGAHPEADDSMWVNSLLSAKSGTLILPIGQKPNDYLLSRFIGKIGLEVLAQRVYDMPGGLDELIDKPELDELRSYVRRGSTKLVWPYSHRRIYEPEFVFNEGDVTFQVAHEYDLLVTPEGEHCIVAAIFGEEFVMNLGGPEITGFERWLTANENASPLYRARDA